MIFESQKTKFNTILELSSSIVMNFTKVELKAELLSLLVSKYEGTCSNDFGYVHKIINIYSISPGITTLNNLSTMIRFNTCFIAMSSMVTVGQTIKNVFLETFNKDIGAYIITDDPFTIFIIAMETNCLVGTRKNLRIVRIKCHKNQIHIIAEII